MADGEPDAVMGCKQHQDGMDTDEVMVLEGTNSNDKASATSLKIWLPKPLLEARAPLNIAWWQQPCRKHAS